MRSGRARSSRPCSLHPAPRPRPPGRSSSSRPVLGRGGEKGGEGVRGARHQPCAWWLLRAAGRRPGARVIGGRMGNVAHQGCVPCHTHTPPHPTSSKHTHNNPLGRTPARPTHLGGGGGTQGGHAARGGQERRAPPTAVPAVLLAAHAAQVEGRRRAALGDHRCCFCAGVGGRAVIDGGEGCCCLAASLAAPPSRTPYTAGWWLVAGGSAACWELTHAKRKDCRRGRCLEVACLHSPQQPLTHLLSPGCTRQGAWRWDGQEQALQGA